MFFKIGVLINFAQFTGKHLRLSLFLTKVAGLSPATLLKKRLWYGCFPVNFAKFLIALFSYNTSGGCLLFLISINIFMKVFMVIRKTKKEKVKKNRDKKSNNFRFLRKS